MPTIIERISAKHRLWDFMNDIKGNISDWPDSEMDLCRQIISSSLAILLPFYSGIEVDIEIRNIYFTMQMPLPDGYMNEFGNMYAKHISSKLRHYE